MSKQKFYNILRDPDSGGYADDIDMNYDSYCNCYRRFIGKPIIDWIPIHFSIFDNIGEGEGFQDYQFDSFAFRLFSQRLKNLLENNKSPDDKIQWLDATVTWNGETRPYYVLHFYEDTDVLDPVLSKWDDKLKMPLALPHVYIQERIDNHNIFSYPGDGTGLTVRAFIVKEIKKQKMTGMTWKPAIVR